MLGRKEGRSQGQDRDRRSGVRWWVEGVVVVVVVVVGG
jgi:hypothetical protein